jgi:hypothetical protein
MLFLFFRPGVDDDVYDLRDGQAVREAARRFMVVTGLYDYSSMRALFSWVENDE